VAAISVLVLVAVGTYSPGDSSVELMMTSNVPHGIGIDEEPYSAPMNLWLYWGSMTNRRFTGSGEHVRHVFKMGNIAGGEWRDPKFLRSLEGGMFNKLSQICCNTLLFPPLEWDFLVVNPNKIVGQDIRAFVANGNSMVFTGGIMSMEFINRYFFYNLEPADGNLDPGPFLRLPHYQGLTKEQHDIMEKSSPRSLPQRGIEVVGVKKGSLPSGTSIIYTSPYNSAVFSIKFCMADNPMSEPTAPLPPRKVLPRDCPAEAAAGRPCSCGFICYVGYDWRDPYPTRWDTALKAVVDLCSQVPPENHAPALLNALQSQPAEQPEESEAEMEADEAKEEGAMKPQAKEEPEEEMGGEEAPAPAERTPKRLSSSARPGPQPVQPAKGPQPLSSAGPVVQPAPVSPVPCVVLDLV